MIDRYWVTSRLADLGFLPPETEAVADEHLRTAVMAYQGFHGLECDGYVGAFTARHLDLPRFCGCPDMLPLALDEALARWPQKVVTWRLGEGSFPGFSREQTVELVKRAVAPWSAAIELDIVHQPEGRVNALLNFGRIDGRGGTLAWSKLPVGVRADSTLDQLYDTDDVPWVDAESPGPAVIDAVRVIRHEWGHMLGLPHIPGDTGDLMNAIYSTRVRDLQAGDLREIRRRYLARATPPPPPTLPPPAPPAAKVFTVKFDRPVSEIQISGKAA